MNQYSLFIGRWQPFHDGHKALIESALNEGKKVLIAIRDTPIDESNPLSVSQRKQMIEGTLSQYKGSFKIITIPDISEVCYGRDVGWGIREIKLDPTTKAISGTQLRKKIKFRKIKTKLFAKSAITYRLSVISIQTLFFFAITGNFKIAIGTSIGWNIINMAWYLAYHYTFAKLFKLGVDKET